MPNVFVFVKENIGRATVYIKARGVYPKDVGHQLKELIGQVRSNIDIDGVSVRITDHQKLQPNGGGKNEGNEV